MVDATGLLGTRWVGAPGTLAIALCACAACGGQSSSDGTGGSAASSGVGGNAGVVVSGGTGGSAGGSGGGGVGGSSGGGEAPECTDAGQCKLHADCCTCMALGPNDPPPPQCLADCVQDRCSALGVETPACEAGRCVAGFDCDRSLVFCNALPPSCEAGLVPSVVGGCWGPCVPANQCKSVNGCPCIWPEMCVAVAEQAGGWRGHCVDVPKGVDILKGCAGSEQWTLCPCVGSSVCIPPYGSCFDADPIPAVICCADGLKPCGSACIDVTSDPNNCGNCGIACRGGRTCQAGQCLCPSSLTPCGDRCADFQSEFDHCGGCDRPCAAGQTCSAGSCTGSVAPDGGADAGSDAG